jgi:hypothetical protein
MYLFYTALAAALQILMCMYLFYTALAAALQILMCCRMLVSNVCKIGRQALRRSISVDMAVIKFSPLCSGEKADSDDDDLICIGTHKKIMMRS